MNWVELVYPTALLSSAQLRIDLGCSKGGCQNTTGSSKAAQASRLGCFGGCCLYYGTIFCIIITCSYVLSSRSAHNDGWQLVTMPRCRNYSIVCTQFLQPLSLPWTPTGRMSPTISGTSIHVLSTSLSLQCTISKSGPFPKESAQRAQHRVSGSSIINI